MNIYAYFKKITSYKFIKKLSKLSYIEKIILYGSRAWDDHNDRSDIVIAIAAPSATNKQWLFEVMSIINNANTLLKIDCVKFDTLNDTNELKKNIIKDRITIYSKENIWKKKTKITFKKTWKCFRDTWRCSERTYQWKTISHRFNNTTLWIFNWIILEST